MKNIVKILLVLGVIFMEKALAKIDTCIISHKQEDKPLSYYIENLEKREKDLALPLGEEKEILKQLSEFDLGKFLLKRKGLDGYWTSYIINKGFGKNDLSSLENWILFKAPVVKATRERFGIFQTVSKKYLKDKAVLASIPCGLMDDLLTLDFDPILTLKFFGIDLDDGSLKLAKKNAKKHEKNLSIFLKRNAWDLNISEEFDLITSNGLNIYEPNEERVINLYKEFFKALKPKGILITSFLTPHMVWKNYNQEDLLKQKAIFSDIIQARWQVFRKEDEMRIHLEKAGFRVLEVLYDSQEMFPTIVAQKP